jgi:DNA polymerase III delta prime subunit
MQCESLWINGSLENGIDTLRGKLQNFAGSYSFDDKKKIIVIDEFDHFSQAGMAAFRGFLDDFSDNCRFIFTGNYKEKIIQPLLDRLHVFDYNNFKKEDMVKPIFERLSYILTNENIEFNPKDLVPVINTYYPSIRSMIGILQKHSTDKFEVVGNLDGLDVYDDLMKFIFAKNYTGAVKLINELNSPDNFYTFLYKKLNSYFDNNQAKVVMVIADYQFKSSSVRDKHLNLAACCAQLMQIKG